ncbi:hypothetical protein PR202_ga28835 [Eleusine coracana subsp. coracana]|uniref:Glycosyltransferase n=1 Tax=Eleusine coracana subsp. coracana TaxID=191504 RepID=A0AAV5DK95_ELECO|nr:hypothetical protein PR202_ga28835 [Eleusine coracana subsp. coracana]
MAQAERSQLRVVMFPWLAHGHITPYLELARRLTKTTTTNQTNLDVVVHLVSTPVNLASIAHHETDRIRLVELHLPEQPNLPPSLHTTKHLPARLMPALKRACDLAAARFGALLDAIRPDLLLYDFLQPWAPVEARNRGVPAAHFSTCSAAATAFFVHHCLHLDEGASRAAFPFEGVGLGGAEEEAKYTELFVMREVPGALVADRDRLLLSLARSEGFVAVKTCAEMERPYMDYLSRRLLLLGGGGGNKEMIPCGPLLVDHHGDGTDAEDVTRWLEEQDPGSVVLVSFGTEYFMSESQMAELARGLELSGHRFLWVVRFPKEHDDEDDGHVAAAQSMPRGFEPAARGMVVEGWAPQRRVLGHSACGAFLTHCGWSSVMEAMAAGVPMVALPLHIDQPINANLAAELGAAVRVPQHRRFGEFRAEDVARAVRAVMRGEGEGKEVRRRAAEMREVVARSDADHDDAQIGALLQRMARLCGKDQQASHLALL